MPAAPSSPLAVAGGFSDAEFQELFGLNWRREGEEIRSSRMTSTCGGRPVQLAAVVSPDGLSIGVPIGQWIGP